MTSLDSTAGTDASALTGAAAAAGAGPTDLAGEDAWRDGLPGDLKYDETLAQIKAPTPQAAIEKLARMTITAQRQVGSDKVVIPKKEADATEWDAFYRALGRPDKPSEYKVPTENMPQGVTIEGPVLESFFNAAHTAGLSGQHAAAVVRWYAKHSEQALAEIDQTNKQAAADAAKALQEKWGTSYDENMRLCGLTLERAAPEGFKEFLNETGYGNDMRMAELLLTVGKMIDQDEIIGSGRRPLTSHTPEQAATAIEQKRLDPEFMKAYNDRMHPGHAAAVKEMQKLYDEAHPPKDEAEEKAMADLKTTKIKTFT